MLYILKHIVPTFAMVREIFIIIIIFAFDARLIVQERKKEDKDNEERNLKDEIKEMRTLLQLLLKKSEAGPENVEC